MCTFCEEARHRMARLAAIMEAWARSRTGVSPQTAAAIDSIYREQYRGAADQANMNMLDGHDPTLEDHSDANNHNNKT